MSVAAALLLPQFFSTARNADGVAFYVRKPVSVEVDAAAAAADGTGAAGAAAAAAGTKKAARRSLEDMVDVQLAELAEAEETMRRSLVAVRAKVMRVRALARAQKQRQDAIAAKQQAAKERRAAKLSAQRAAGKVNGLTMYCFVDAALADFLGVDMQTCVRRHDVTSFFAAYVKQNGLSVAVAETGKKRVQLDDKLRALLGADNAAKIDSGSVVLTPIVFNQMIGSHYKDLAQEPTAEQQEEIAKLSTRGLQPLPNDTPLTVAQE